MSDVAKTPREELECKKKYLYEYSMFWECNDGFKSQILEDDVVDLLNELNEENKTLKAQLYCEGSVCTICKHQQLTPDKCMQGYYTAKCEKGHEECSKEDLKYCKDFKLKELEDE